jgi:prepilin-type processing-associated H-X9-DG protein
MLELLVSVVIIAILATLLLPFLSRARESARRTQCRNNLGQIGKAIMMYSDSYDDMMPAVLPPGVSTAELHDGEEKNGLGLLFPGYTRDQRIFYCPSSNYLNYGAFENWGKGPVQSTFFYRGAGDGTETLVMRDKKAILMDNNRQAAIGRHCHGGRFLNVLFADGHTTGVDDWEYQASQANVMDLWQWLDLQ